MSGRKMWTFNEVERKKGGFFLIVPKSSLNLKYNKENADWNDNYGIKFFFLLYFTADLIKKNCSSADYINCEKE